MLGLWWNKSPSCSSLSLSCKTLSKIFDRTSPGPEAARALIGLQQGACFVSNYATKFCTLAGMTSRSVTPFTTAYLATLKVLLVTLNQTPDLDSLTTFTLKL